MHHDIWYYFIDSLEFFAPIILGPIVIFAIAVSAQAEKDTKIGNEKLKKASEYDPEVIFGNAHYMRDAEIWSKYFEP